MDRYYELTLRTGNRKALRERFLQLDSAGRPDLIPSVKQPTLIIWGKKDKLVPPENAEKFGRDIKESRVVIFENLGHTPQDEYPEASVAEVIRFTGK